MEIKAGKEKHFEGPEGLYYDAETDMLWLLLNEEMKLVYNEKKGCVCSYAQYEVWTSGISGKRFVIVGPPFDSFKKIGEFD